MVDDGFDESVLPLMDWTWYLAMSGRAEASEEGTRKREVGKMEELEKEG